MTELPLPQPHVTECQLHTLARARCGATTSASLAVGVPRGAFGPRLEATVAVCTGVYHLSRRLTVGLLGDLFGVELAMPTVSACEQGVSQAVAEPVAEAHRYVQEQEVVHVDETGWREGPHRAWLWVMVSALVTVFSGSSPRPAVLWRKGCFGTHSAAASRFAERMLTVATTLKQQVRNVVDYLAQTCAASLHGQLPPSLLHDAVTAPSRRLATV